VAAIALLNPPERL
jgi:hypothetical protein